MNRKFMNSIIICITFISVCIMMYTYKSAENNISYSKIAEYTVENSKSKNKEVSNGNVNDKIQSNKKEISNVFNGEKKIKENIKEKKPKKQNVSNIDNITKKDISSKKAYIYKEKEECKPVFKIAKNKIKSKLSLFEKIQVLNIIRKKLSQEEYKNIEKNFNSKKDREAVKSSLKILRKKLSDKEYEKILKICSKFINMDVVES